MSKEPTAAEKMIGGFAPKLVEHYERLKNDPRTKAYYAQHSVAG